MTPEQVLAAFYKDIHEWVSKGFPKHRVFRKDKAMCSSLYGYAMFVHRLTGHRANEVCFNLRNQFLNAGLDSILPFNMVACNERFFSGSAYYYLEIENYSVYDNIHRLKWIEDHVNNARKTGD